MPRRSRRLSLAVMSAAIAALALAACGSSGSSSSSTSTTSAGSATTAGTGPNTPAPKPLATKTSVVISFPAKVESFAAPVVAQAMGEFAKENLDVQVIQDPGGANSEAQELAQGQVQMCITGLNAGNFNAISSGVALRYVGYPYSYQKGDQQGFYVNKKYLNSDGTFNKSMVGSFVVTLGTAGVAAANTIQVQQWLQKSGVSLSQIQVQKIAGPPALQALQNGAVGGATLLSPYYQPIVNDPNFVNVTGSLIATGVYEMYQPWVQQHRDVADAIIRALIRTDRTWLAPGYRDNTQVMSAISNWLAVPTATINNNPPVDFSTTLDMSPLNTFITDVQSMWMNLGGVLNYSKPLTLDQIVDTSVVKDVLG